METKEDELVEAGKQKEDDEKAGGGRRKKDMVKMGGKHDNRLVFGTLQRKDEMLERYERDVRKLQSRHMRVYGQLLHFAYSFHPSFMHPSPPSVSSWLDCSFGQPKPFLYSADRSIADMVQSVLKPTCNPPSCPHNPIISSSITISISFDQYYLSNYSSLTPVYCAHMCLCFSHARHKRH